MHSKAQDPSFEGLYKIVSTLRNPGGCPWDQKQTPETLKSALIEEAFECIDAIEQGDPPHIKEELGDVMLLVSMILRIYEERGVFTKEDVFLEIGDKLIRRHPHVFAETVIADPKEVVRQWDQIKNDVEGRGKENTLSEVPKNIPPLERSYRLQKKAAKRGFDWQEVSQVLTKLQEEINEFQSLLDAPEPSPETLEEELGDILFTAVNLCRFMNFDPTLALHGANKKFIRRFGYVETRMKEESPRPSGEDPNRMEVLWKEAKRKEGNDPPNP